jgi:hypothetical protein
MAVEFKRRGRDRDGASIRAEAEVDDVHDQTAFVVRNTAALALQLTKRFRNVRCADCTGRIAPSVMLSCYADMVA